MSTSDGQERRGRKRRPLCVARAGLSSYLYRLCITCVNLSMLWVVSTPLRYSFVRWVGILKLHNQGGRRSDLFTLGALAATGQDSQVLPPERDDPARFKMRDGLAIRRGRGLGSEESWKLGTPHGLAVRRGCECLA
jgi:hypothetical protein